LPLQNIACVYVRLIINHVLHSVAYQGCNTHKKIENWERMKTIHVIEFVAFNDCKKLTLQVTELHVVATYSAESV